MAAHALAGLVLAGALLAAGPATAAPDSPFPTADEALELAFPDCTVERETAYLTKEQRRAAEELAGLELDSAVAWIYTARDEEGELAGYAYFDTHEVRTKKETLMVAILPDERVRRIELLAFAEPREYIPAPKWYAQFVGRRLDPDLRLDADIRGVTGATLTARATTAAVRRILAVHRVLRGRPVPAGDGGADA